MLYVGNDAQRYHSEHSAMIAGAARHRADSPAKIEITPDGGGPMSTTCYDPDTGAWVDHSE
jgi:hypothetical protein